MPPSVYHHDGRPEIGEVISNWATYDEMSEVSWLIIRPGYIVALFVAGWAINVDVFQRFSIDYERALGLGSIECPKPKSILVCVSIWILLLSLARLLLMTHMPTVGALWGILLLYVTTCLLVMMALWVPQPRATSWRVPLSRAIWRSFRPLRTKEVPFVEVLVADGLTSISKVLYDLGVGTCTLYSVTKAGGMHWLPGSIDVFGDNVTDLAAITRPRLTECLDGCSRSTMPILVQMLPTLIRARQCLVSSRNAPDPLARTLHLVNLAKYISAVPVIVLALLYAKQKVEYFLPFGSSDDFEVMWALTAVLNAVFSYMWDIVMDWGLLHPVSIDAENKRSIFCLRPVLLFRDVKFFYWSAMILDLIGRTLWSLRWSAVFQELAPFYLTSLQQSAEVLRRCMWNVIRVEWECVKRGFGPVDQVTNRSAVGSSCLQTAQVVRAAAAVCKVELAPVLYGKARISP